MRPMRASAGGWGRRVLCQHYGRCLDRTLTRGWPGFSCGDCRDFRETGDPPEMWIEDAIKCVRLLNAVENKRGRQVA